MGGCFCCCSKGRRLNNSPPFYHWALTGESLPVTKRTGDEDFSGSTCKQGEIEAVVIATRLHSFFGKDAHLVDSTESIGHFQKVLTAIGNFCIFSIVVGMILEIILMYPIQLHSYRDGINNLLVLLIGGIPIAMPTVVSVTLAIGSHRLSQLGAITKRMTAIEEMAGMDVLRSDKTRTLTLNRLTIYQNLIEVIQEGKNLFVYRHVQTSQKCISFVSIQWTNALQLRTLILMATGIGPAKDLLNR
ncbi:hypothetical protein ACSBR1_020969 [Camellia fascicularis]